MPYPGKWSYSNSDKSQGKYNPAPEDFLNPGIYTDEYGNATKVGVADWQDLIYQDGFSQEYNISVSGGSRNGSWHSFSGNYLKQQGIIKESGFTRYSIRANMGRKIKSWLDMGVNISFLIRTPTFPGRTLMIMELSVPRSCFRLLMTRVTMRH